MPKYGGDEYHVAANMLKVRKIIHDPKQRVAFSSVLAAAFLIVLKLYVGLVTNSLGILSEALHSSLDFVAAFITMSAVVSASKPADSDHHFGHGKSENLSAMVETILLLITCFWIFAEAFNRVFISHQFVEANLWAFGTMAISIVVDVSRSRVLYRAARKYNSQALEADALHFSSDILSSSVVIAGLVFVRLGLPLGDPLGAVGVGILVLIVSLRLGRRTLDYLMDKAPAGMTEVVKRNVERLEGVKIERIRIRSAGSNQFVDLKISLDRSMSLESSHDVVSNVEAKVWEVFAGADVVVQVEPRITPDENLSSKIILIASKEKGITHVHNIIVQKIGGDIVIDLHVEVDPNIRVTDAHKLVSNFENKLKSQLGIKRVDSHIEVREKEGLPSEDMTRGYPDLVERIERIVRMFPEIVDCHDISVRSVGGKISVSMHCIIPADQPVAKAHEVTTDIENALKSKIARLDYVTIHVEPETSSAQT
jgi:cation diffusion facilitator family transporter